MTETAPTAAPSLSTVSTAAALTDGSALNRAREAICTRLSLKEDKNKMKKIQKRLKVKQKRRQKGQHESREASSQLCRCKAEANTSIWPKPILYILSYVCVSMRTAIDTGKLCRIEVLRKCCLMMCKWVLKLRSYVVGLASIVLAVNIFGQREATTHNMITHFIPGAHIKIFYLQGVKQAR